MVSTTQYIINTGFCTSFAETKTTKTSLKACGIGFASCLSINSMKLLSSHGEAGMTYTDDQELSNLLNHLEAKVATNRECQLRLAELKNRNHSSCNYT